MRVENSQVKTKRFGFPAEKDCKPQVSRMAPMTLLTQEPLTFAPHTPVDDWPATQDVA